MNRLLGLVVAGILLAGCAQAPTVYQQLAVAETSVTTTNNLVTARLADATLRYTSVQSATERVILQGEVERAKRIAEATRQAGAFLDLAELALVNGAPEDALDYLAVVDRVLAAVERQLR